MSFSVRVSGAMAAVVAKIESGAVAARRFVMLPVGRRSFDDDEGPGDGLLVRSADLRGGGASADGTELCFSRLDVEPEAGKLSCRRGSESDARRVVVEAEAGVCALRISEGRINFGGPEGAVVLDQSFAGT